MKKTILIQIIIITGFIGVLSYGFYKSVADDGPNIISYINSGGEVQMSATNTQQFNSDMLGTWTLGANIPSPGSFGGAGVSYTRNDTTFIYCINGDVDGAGTAPGQFRVYNVQTNTWTSLTNYPSGRHWVSGGRVASYVYAVGGLPSGTMLWSQVTGTLQRYNITSGTWATMNPAPIPCGSPGVVGYQDSLLYAIGGMGISGQPITTVQLYNQTSGTWRMATVLPQARANGWVWNNGDTIYYGCGAGPTTSTFNINVLKGVISQSDRAVITWTTASVTYPIAQHRCDAANFVCFGCIVGPGATAWWGQGTACYTWVGGNHAFVSAGNLPYMTADAMVGSGSFYRGNYRIWKFAVISGFCTPAPYHLLNNQIYTDSCLWLTPGLISCRNNINKYVPDNSTVYDTLKVIGYNNCFITKVNVKIDTFYHTWDGDITFSLIHYPNTTNLIQNRGGSGDNFIGTVLNDDAYTPISSGSPPFTGWFRPEQPLSTFNNYCVTGDWILIVNDNKTSDTGLLKAWCIELYFNCGPPCTIGINKNNNEIPEQFSLSQNYPNPFNPKSKIKYQIAKSQIQNQKVLLIIYNSLGQEIVTLVNQIQSAGIYEAEWDGTNYPSGVYFYQLLVTDEQSSVIFSDTKKMALIK